MFYRKMVDGTLSRGSELDILGDQNFMKNGQDYYVVCDANSVSCEPGSTDFRQINKKTNFKRSVARFNRPCIN